MPHVRTHAAMFTSALRRRDRHELVGQLFRIIVAAPGSMTGKYPVGNTGGADVSAFRPMPIPDDLPRRARAGRTFGDERVIACFPRTLHDAYGR